MARRVFAFVAIAFACAVTAVNGARTASVYYNATTQEWTMKETYDPNAVAWATFDDGLATTGWGVLDVQTNKKFPDSTAMFGAGYLEGALTADRIYEHFNNMWDMLLGNATTPPADLTAWLQTQDKWSRDQMATNKSDIWTHMALLTQQFDGLRAGWDAHHSAGQQMDLFAFQLTNDVGDFFDLLSALGHGPDYSKMTPSEFASYVRTHTSCSALVKVTGDFSDLFATHSTWLSYGSMNRMYKHYRFDLQSSSNVNPISSFSSYPGTLSSLDDFFILGSGLTVLETTNSIFDTSLYKKIVPQSLFTWQRARVANAVSKDGPTWYNTFKQYNSGTYNNQYVVIDFKLFTPHQPLLPNTLWVLEQIPGFVQGADLTRELERGYFPSYNVPYFLDIYNISGYPEIVAKYGPDYSYQLCPRAQIFRRDEATVTDIESLKNLMRSNNWQTDPFAKGSPWNAICSRGDLQPGQPGASGCTDTKVTNYAMQKLQQSYAQSGPTTENNPPFSWTAPFASTRHDGQPTTFDFEFETLQPKQF